MPKPQYLELKFPAGASGLPVHTLAGYVIVSDGKWDNTRHLFLRKVDAPVPAKPRKAPKAKPEPATQPQAS